VRSLDLPDEPDEPRRVEHAGAASQDRPTPRSRELPDPDERARAYEAVRAYVSAETPTEALPGQRPDAGGQRSSKDEAPQFDNAWADHERRWPERPHAATDGSGDRSELPAAAAEGRARESERTLCADAQAIEQENKHGGRLEGSEPRPDGEDRLEEEPSAETAEQASPDAADQRSYWDEVPRFQDMWADHERRWPERQHAAEPNHWNDPPGTYRSKGGFRLDPERHAETTEAIGRMRETEPSISTDMQMIEKENTYKGWLAGFDHRVKGNYRLKEKVAEELKAEQLQTAPRKTATEAVREIPDAIRFTSCLESGNYTRGYYDIKARLESLGYQMYLSRNSWDGREYKGINTRWVTPERQRFEVQFHTPESFHAKEDITHKAYERIRNAMITDRERKELREFQREVSRAVPIPDGAMDIPDYKKEGF
jgi:hypothetical protein